MKFKGNDEYKVSGTKKFILNCQFLSWLIASCLMFFLSKSPLSLFIPNLLRLPVLHRGSNSMPPAAVCTFPKLSLLQLFSFWPRLVIENENQFHMCVAIFFWQYVYISDQELLVLTGDSKASQIPYSSYLSQGWSCPKSIPLYWV